MGRIKISISILVILLFGLFAKPVYAEDPLPPQELIDWLEYALKRFPPVDCPYLNSSTTKCAAVTEIQLSGDLKTGNLNVDFIGYNWSRTDQTLLLLGPASTFALENSSIELSEQYDPEAGDEVFIAPFFETSGGFWKVTVPPGKFKLASTASFKPQSVVPLNLAQGVGRIETSGLKGGYVQFDLNEGSHGGEVQLVLEGKKQVTPEKPQVRVTRIFKWGRIPTFEYVVTVSGLRREALVSIPLFSSEIIEKLSPDKPYTLNTKNGERFLEATFSPTSTELKISGHYKKAPTSFEMQDDLPFEVWIHVSDRRYPVNLETNANPIDPTEFSNILDIESARAFLVKPGQKMSFHSVKLTVDEGRKGKGKIIYKFFEGTDGFWLEKLFLSAKILGQDRLVIPTLAPPTYAGIGDNGIELYKNKDGQLSVRLPTEGLNKEKPIEVDWNITRKSTLFFSIFKSELPAQNVYLEEQNVTVHFQPGMVPIYAWGASITKGDLLDQFHLYGFLIGILAFFVCRGLKFNWILSAFVTLLFVGLYLEPKFPTSAVLLLLILTLPIVRLSDDFFNSLKQKTFRRRLILIIWGIMFLITLIPLTRYSRAQVYEALHPYADQRPGSIGFYGGDEDEDRKYKKSKKRKMKYKKRKMDVVSGLKTTASTPKAPSYYQQQNQQVQRYIKDQSLQVSEWNAKPVSLNNYTRGGRKVRFTSYNIDAEKGSKVSVLIVGPVVRGLWMLIETGLILWMMAAVLVRARRLFKF